jgi:hypothetical protein
VGLASGCDNPLIRGGVVELDQHTGQVQHTWHSVPTGSVGGSVWSSVAVSPAGTDVWASTGNECGPTINTCPAGNQIVHSLSIVHLSGSLKFLQAWRVPGAAGHGHDWDFGSSPHPVRQVRLFRDPGLRWFRVVGVAFPVLAVVYIVTGGKPYYLSVLLPALIAAGARPTVNWITRGHAKARWGLIAAELLLSLASLPATLPIVPVSDTPAIELNSTAAQTVGWPARQLVKDLAVAALPRLITTACHATPGAC